MVGQLDHLNQAVIRGNAGDDQPRFRQTVAERVVHLIAVAMALVDNLLAIGLERHGLGSDLARIGAQSHGAALVLDVFLLGHQVDNGELGILVELRRRRARHARHIARELAYRRLHAQADAQKRHVMRAGVAHRADLALEGALAEAAGHQDAVHGPQHFPDVAVVELFAVDEMHVDLGVVVHTRMMQRLDDRQIRVGQAGVLAHDSHIAVMLHMGGRIHKRAQGG